MTEDTIFRIYSMTKPITSVALMMLYEQGHFQLGDRVSKFIPEWKDLQVYVSGEYPDFVTRPPEREMTVRDLLTHTSGLASGMLGQAGTKVDAAYQRLKLREGTLKDMVQKVARLPLEFSPGTRWNYGTSTDVCGYLAELFQKSGAFSRSSYARSGVRSIWSRYTFPLKKMFTGTIFIPCLSISSFGTQAMLSTTITILPIRQPHTSYIEVPTYASTS
jgi:hypothetical protein